MPALRVVVAVTPRLLADALSRALAQDGWDVINADTGSLLEEYDVAVVTGDRAGEVRARHVVRLPDDGSGPGGLASLALLRDTLADLR